MTHAGLAQDGRPQGISRRPLVIVAAVARNGVIGAGNALPWRLRSDLARFRALTMGRPVIMGRRTFESLPPARPGKGGRLPGRPLVVLARSDFPISPDDGEVVRAASLDAAVATADALAARDGADAIIVAGGGDVFAQALPLASRLHVTWVDSAPDGDAFFPNIDNAGFRETAREAHPAGERDDHAFVFVDYER
ncbi:dihydrofolate reductase [Pseudochelatococcus sp. B33]